MGGPFVLWGPGAGDPRVAHRLSGGAGWPHRLEDWHLFHALGGGVVACEGTGELVGTAMSWRYGPGAGTLGMILVSPAQQGKGIGRRLTEALLHDAGARSLMLHATRAGRRLYAASGVRVSDHIRQ